jgi:3-deoxy-D-manno-octulosonic-acid transferase
MLRLYSIFIRLVGALLPIAALFSNKMKLFVVGRKNWKEALNSWKKSHGAENLLVVHCASLGEFEMAVPFLEYMKLQNDWTVVVTFFSPSGYNQRRDTHLASTVFYLPLDTRRNMDYFLKTLSPKVFFFVKYDLWFNLLRSLNEKQVDTFVMNGFFRKDHFLNQAWALKLRKTLQVVNTFYVQEDGSASVLHNWGFNNVEVCGDMRFDRVKNLPKQALTRLNEFKEDAFLIIAGSSWQAEEKLLAEFYANKPRGVKLVIVPHDVSRAHIKEIDRIFDVYAVPISKWSEEEIAKDSVLVIDQIGLLQQAYLSADMAFIGGGFSGNVHNVLEPVMAGIPILCGPKSDKFPEVSILEQSGVLYTVTNKLGLHELVDTFIGSEEDQIRVQNSSAKVLDQLQGATLRMINSWQTKINPKV